MSGRLLCLAILLASATPGAHAALPAGYTGMAVHVTFDGSGKWSRTYSTMAQEPPFPTQTYSATADVTWHNEYDVPVPAAAIGNSSPAGAGTTVSGSSGIDSNFLPSCLASITRKTQTPTPFIGLYGGPYSFDAKPPPVITLFIDTFGGYDYALCDGQTGILTGNFAPAGDGITYNYAIGIAKFDLDLNEWANQPPHERSIEVSGSETAAPITGTNEQASASWSGTITLKSSRAGGPTVPGLSQDEKDFAAFEFFGEFVQFVAECFVGEGNDVFSGADAAVAPVVTQTMVDTSAADCFVWSFYLPYLASIVDDPPDPSFHDVARVVPSPAPALALPSCAAIGGADRRFCTRLEKGATRYAAKVQRLADVAKALSTTADRLSGAAAAGEVRDAKRQRKAFGRLRRKLEASIRARGKAGSKLAALLQSANVTAQISQAQAAPAIDAAVARLTAQGLTPEVVQALAGANATPQAIDILAQLAGD